LVRFSDANTTEILSALSDPELHDIEQTRSMVTGPALYAASNSGSPPVTLDCIACNVWRGGGSR
jgi:hypothetical protein